MSCDRFCCFWLRAQAEGVVSGAETRRWRASWAAAAEAQWAAAGAGKFKESAAQFLISSWQGDALSVGVVSCVQYILSCWNLPLLATTCSNPGQR
jgi:hypothetical protein